MSWSVSLHLLTSNLAWNAIQAVPSLPLQFFQHLSDEEWCQLCFRFHIFFTGMNSLQQNYLLNREPTASAKAELPCAISTYRESDSLSPETWEGQFIQSASPWSRRWSHGLGWCQPPGMPNCPPTLSFADPGSFPRLPASLAGISAEVHSCKGGSTGRHRGPSRHPNQPKRCVGTMMKQNPCVMPTNMFLEGPYPDTMTSTSWMYGTTGYPKLAGGCMFKHPEPSLGMKGPTEEQVFGMSWICSWQGLERGSAGRAESAFCHPSTTAVAWASQVLTSKST